MSVTYISAFPDGGNIQDNDIITGLRNGLNTDFEAQGYLNYKNACYASATANLNASYNNGTSGVGATLTNAGTQATFAIDGVTPPVNSRILVPSQTTAYQNGIYILTDAGSPSSNWVLTRAKDYDTPSKIHFDFVPILNGTLNGNIIFKQTNTVTTIGVDAITFTQMTDSASTKKASDTSNTYVASVNGATVVNDIPVFNDVKGTIVDSGIPSTAITTLGTAAYKTASNNADTYLSSVDGTPAVNNLPIFSDTKGSIVDSGKSIYSIGRIITGSTYSVVQSDFAQRLQSNPALGADQTFTLPSYSAVPDGWYVIFENINGSNFNINVSTSSGVIRGANQIKPQNQVMYINRQGAGEFIAYAFGEYPALFTVNNLSDLTNVTSARTNLGLGNAALKTVTDNAQTKVVSLVGTPASGNLASFDGNDSVQDSGISSTSIFTPSTVLYKNAVLVATTHNYNATYSNGTSGVGATLTSNVIGAFSADGVNPPVNSRVLIKDQTSSFQNGIYIVTDAGAPLTQWVLTRATDYNTPTKIHVGDFIPVIQGSINGGLIFRGATAPATIGVDAITYTNYTQNAATKVVTDSNQSKAVSLVGTPVAGNLASFDSNGSIQDSGFAPGVFGIITESGNSRILSNSDVNKLINFTSNGDVNGVINITINTGIASVGAKIFMVNTGNGEAIINATAVPGVTINGPIQFVNGNLIVATQVTTNTWEITNGNSESMYEYVTGFSGASSFAFGDVVYAQSFDSQNYINGRNQYPTVSLMSDVSQVPFGIALGSISANQSANFLKRGTLKVGLEPGFSPGSYVYANNAGALTLISSAITGTKTVVGIVLNSDNVPDYIIYFDVNFLQPNILPTYFDAAGPVIINQNQTGACFVSFGALDYNLPQIGSLSSTLAPFGTNYSFVNNSTVNVTIHADQTTPDSIYQTGQINYVLSPGQAVSVTEDGINGIWYVTSSNPGNALAQPSKAVATGYTLQFGDLGFYLYNNESSAATINIQPNSTMPTDANYWFEFACDNPAGCTLVFDSGDTVIGSTSMIYGSWAKINKIYSVLPSGTSVWQISQTIIPVLTLSNFTFDTSNITDNYLIGDTINLAGGTYSTQAVIQVTAVHLATYNISNGGTGYNVGDYITFSGTTPAVGYVTTVSGGAVTGLSFSNPPHTSATRGSYTSTPSTLTQASTTGGGSGIVLNTLTWGTEAGTIVNSGSYSLVPSNPVLQASTSGSGTGAQINATWQLSTFSGVLGTSAYKNTTDNTKPNVVALNTFTNGNLIKADVNGSATDSGLNASAVPIVVSHTNGNFAEYNSSGNLIDSGISATGIISFTGTATVGNAPKFLNTTGGIQSSSFSIVNYFVPAYEFYAPPTNGATFASSSVLSNGGCYPAWNFGNVSTQYIFGQIYLPPNYDLTTNQFKIRVAWYATSGTALQTVVWYFDAFIVKDAVSINQTFSSPILVADSMSAINTMQVSSFTAFMTPSGATPDSFHTNMLQFRIYRKPGVLSDDLNASAFLTSVALQLQCV